MENNKSTEEKLKEVTELKQNLEEQLAVVRDEYETILSEKKMITNKSYVGKFYKQRRANDHIYSYVFDYYDNGGDYYFKSITVAQHMPISSFQWTVMTDYYFDPTQKHHFTDEYPTEIPKEEFIEYYYSALEYINTPLTNIIIKQQ